MSAPATASAGIDPSARIGASVQLANPCRVGPDVVIGGPAEIGPGLRAEARALLGGPAQHQLGDRGVLRIGRDLHVHEAATIHRGSPAGAGVTRIGDGVRVMAYAHVGHDAVLGDGCTLANGAQLGGHVEIGAGAVIGARAALHQFVCVGRGAMVAAGAFVSGDVLPWTLAAGDRARTVGPNRVALRRAGFDGRQVSRALRLLLRSGGPGVPEIREDLRHEFGAVCESAEDLLRFAARPRHRPLCPRGR